LPWKEKSPVTFTDAVGEPSPRTRPPVGVALRRSRRPTCALFAPGKSRRGYDETVAERHRRLTNQSKRVIAPPLGWTREEPSFTIDRRSSRLDPIGQTADSERLDQERAVTGRRVVARSRTGS
jgi:hypothetical protein